MLIGSKSARSIPCIKAGQILVVENPQRSFVHSTNSVIVGLDQETTIFVYCSTDARYRVLWEGDLDPEGSVNGATPPFIHYFRRVAQVIEGRPYLVENCPEKDPKIMLFFSGYESHGYCSRGKLSFALIDV